MFAIGILNALSPDQEASTKIDDEHSLINQVHDHRYMQHRVRPRDMSGAYNL